MAGRSHRIRERRKLRRAAAEGVKRLRALAVEGAPFPSLTPEMAKRLRDYMNRVAVGDGTFRSVLALRVAAPELRSVLALDDAPPVEYTPPTEEP